MRSAFLDLGRRLFDGGFNRHHFASLNMLSLFLIDRRGHAHWYLLSGCLH
jgi:hypothetical protein